LGLCLDTCNLKRNEKRRAEPAGSARRGVSNWVVLRLFGSSPHCSGHPRAVQVVPALCGSSLGRSCGPCTIRVVLGLFVSSSLRWRHRGWGVYLHVGIGFLRLCVFQHVGIGFLCLCVSFDTLALASLRLTSSGGWPPPRLVNDGLAAPCCGSCRHRGSATRALGSPCPSVVRLVVRGMFRRFTHGRDDLTWVCRGGRVVVLEG